MGIGIVLGDESRTISRYCGRGTNQLAEILALRESLQLAAAGDTIFSDSQYAIKVARRIWRAKIYVDYLEEIWSLLSSKRVEPRWIPGHKGDRLQELADRLAYNAAKTRRSTIDPPVITVGAGTERVEARSIRNPLACEGGEMRSGIDQETGQVRPAHTGV
jgi:ribonuclease HI